MSWPDPTVKRHRAMQLGPVLFLSLVCTAQAGLLGGMVAHDESDRLKTSEGSQSRSVGLLSGVGGISHDHKGAEEGHKGAEEGHSLLLEGIGGISSRNQGAAQLALRDSFGKDGDSSDDTEKNDVESDSVAEVILPIFSYFLFHPFNSFSSILVF